jgi:hypothetical protein
MVNFSITASGSSLAYKWQKNLVDISGAIAASYITPAITLADNGAKFRCIVSNAVGADTSLDGVLTVNAAAPTITSYPSNQTVTEGKTATFTISASGLNIVYQWKRNDTLIANANSTSYTISVTSMADNGSLFSCVVGNLAGTVTSNSVVLTVNMAPPIITAQPKPSQTIAEGATAGFSIAATGTNISYQWQKNDTNIIGALSPSYMTPTLTSGDNGTKFRCLVSNAGGSVYSNEGFVLVTTAPPVIVTNPVSDTVSEGSQAMFTVSASGSNLSYQWLKNGAPISSNATNFTYTIPSALYSDNGASFKCIVTNPGGNATSASAILTVVIDKPHIIVQPQSQSARVGAVVNFSVSATGSNLAYQWQKNNVAITSATAASYFTPAVTATDNGVTFRCVVTNSAGSETSNLATLSISDSVAKITSQPINQTVDAGKTVSFSIVASGSNLNYQWQKNGIDIPNAVSASYTTPPVFHADSGAAYRCVVTNAGGSILSNQAILSVTTPQFTVSIGNAGNGQTSPFGKVTMYYGDSMDIKAIAYQSYRFNHWQIDSGTAVIIDSSSPATRIICSKINATITAYFTLDTCGLTVSSMTGGHVTPSGHVTVGVGAPTIVKAIADIGFRFDHWSGVKGNPFIVDSTSDSTQVALLSSAEVRAVFSGALCTLTVKTQMPPDTAKTVLDTMVAPGDTVPLVAPTTLGAVFTKWMVTGGTAILLDSSVASAKLITKSGNVTVVAVFHDISAVIVRHSRLIPSRFALRFQQATGVLYYDVPRVEGKASVALKIRLFDARGRLLKAIQQPALEPGYYHVTLFGGHAAIRSAALFEVCVMESEGFKKAITVRCVR